MYSSFFVIYVLIAVATATAPILVSECGTLETPYATYQLAKDIAVSDPSDGFVCIDIKGNGITLEGNGFGLSSASNELMYATGVQYSGMNTIVQNIRITNFRTGIRANGKFGKVDHNTIAQAVNGIDVTATNNDISNNVIGNFNADDSTSGIYVYFPAREPIASFITITNNVISNIRGDSFVLGISVYYATAVTVANNRIYDLIGGILKEEISVMQGEAAMDNNVFTAPVTEDFLPSTTLLLSASIVLASALWFFRTPSTIPTPIDLGKKALSKKAMEKEMEKAKAQKDKRAVQKDEFDDDEDEDEEDEQEAKPTPITFTASSPGMFS